MENLKKKKKYYDESHKIYIKKKKNIKTVGAKKTI